MSATSLLNAAPKGPPIGVIGLGLIGSAIAARLTTAGFTVVGWDRDETRRSVLSPLGGAFASGAVEVFSKCERVVLSLPDLNVVSELLTQVREHLRAGQIIFDTTTGSPDDAEKLGREHAQLGVAYLDATISGNSEQLRTGDVTLMVGGSEGGVAHCEDIARSLANKIFHTGPTGSGSRMKLVTNLVLGLNRAALAEGLVFSRALGLDLEMTLQIMRESAAYSRIMDVKGEKMIREEFAPQARLSQHLKDVRLMLESGANADVNLPLTETHRQLLEIAESLGCGVLDNSAVIRAFSHWPGADETK